MTIKKITNTSIERNYLRLMLLLCIIAIVGCKDSKPSPKKSPPTKQWFKGNLHTHSYWSDGDEFPEVIMDWYKSNDYQFVALTDHNTLAEGEKWVTISNDSIYQEAFKNYLNTYGSDWIEHKKDSLNNTQVKLKTYEEYRPKFEKEGEFLIIQSEEITDGHDGKHVHINATNVKQKIEPQGGNSIVEVMQNNLDAVAKQKEAFGHPIIAHINHPNFWFSISLEDMIALKNEQFFEIYNGHPSVHNSGNDTIMSTEMMWDYINIAYLENNKPIMYGLATDDSHHYHTIGSKWSNAGRGWIMVQADTLSPKSIINAMEEGQFYASTGVTLKDVRFQNSKLSIVVKKEENVNYTISFIGCKKGEIEPEEFMSVKRDSASFELTDDILFVRCKITSSKLHKNPIEDLIYETAWTQPVITK